MRKTQPLHEVTLWVLNDEVLEGCTHVNPVDHVVSEMLVSWFPLREKYLRGTTPGKITLNNSNQLVNLEFIIKGYQGHNQQMRGREQGKSGNRRGTKGPSSHSMMEEGTHVNVAGHVVPEMLVSWLPLRDSDLRGKTPGAVRD